jgi:hypothetical protein
VVAAIRTSEPASVALRLTRSGSMRVLAQARGSSRTGVLRLVIARRVAGRRLAPGRHEVTIVARADGRTAATRLALLVR